MQGHASAVALAAALLLAAAVPDARAAGVHVVTPGGDAVNGTLDEPGSVDRLPFRLVDGSILTIQLKAAKGSALLPELVLLGPDREPEPGFATAAVTASKGNAVSVKNFLVTGTGARWLEIRGASGTTGGWQFKAKMKLPKKAAGGGQAAGGAGVFSFTSPGNATATLSVSAAKGSAAFPVFGKVVGPDGKDVFVDLVTATKTGFSMKAQSFPLPGTHEVRFTSAADGPWTAKASFKIPKFLKRTLLDTEIVTDPILTSIDPTGGDTSLFIQGTADVDFGIPGATLTFRKAGSAATVPQNQLVVGEDELQFSISLASFQAGIYDVEFINPDGGASTLTKAFTVTNAPAAPATVTPGFGIDSETVTLTIAGARLSASAAVRLERSGETITGTNVIGGATQIQADFDLLGHSLGLWDVVVTVPDSPSSTLVAAFEIRNTPPEVLTFTPGDNLVSSLIDGVIGGNWFDPTPTVLLRRSGSLDIPGTSVVHVSSTEVQASFDTTGAVRGDWDLVVTNPDAQSATLAGAFHVYKGVTSVGSPAKVFAPGGTLQSPPAVAYGAPQDQYAVAWMDAGSGSWNVYIQRIDASGNVLGSPVSVSSGGATVRKRDPGVAWDPVNDQFIVTWSQIVALNSGSVTSKHPSYQYLSTGVLSVFAQRYKASDLSAVGANVQISDHTLSNGWYMDEFPNFRSVPAWDAASKVWVVHWMQEWDTSNLYSTDDFDVLNRTLDPATGTMGGITGVSTGSHHEGEPGVAWDPVAKRMAVCFNDRSTPTSYLFIKAGGASMATDGSADLVDPALAVDSVSGRWILTWTRKPATGNTTVQALLIDASGTPTALGTPVTVGTGSGDHRTARPLYNPVAEESLIAWTRADTSGNLTVRMRRVQTTGSGLTLVGTEEEASNASGDEADPAVLFASGDGSSSIFWVKTMNFDSTSGGYPGALFSGNWRGLELWLHRYQ